MMRHFLPFAALAALLPVAAHAEDESARALAEKRLRGCLAAGASSAPGGTLAAAIASARAFCGPQINTVADYRVEAATQGLEGEAAEEVKARTLRTLNNEIAHAVANFTGLAHQHAAH